MTELNNSCIQHYPKDQHIYDYISQLDLAGKINYMFNPRKTLHSKGLAR